MYGEQRAAAVSDFNNDGRVDLVISQNGAKTKIFQNQIAKQGLRIHLNGPPVNEAAIGSTVRVIYQDGTKGPARTIQAGSGYWSQNGLTQVLGYKEIPRAVEVLWFDGTRQNVEIKSNKWSYKINYYQTSQQMLD